MEASRNEPPVCLSENSHRLASLWWVMHQSDDPKRLASVVTLYLDESSTDDNAPIACVGGLLLNKDGFESLDLGLPRILEKHGITSPLHIKDFRRPKGRLADISIDVRRAFFADVVRAINDSKLYSIAATVTTASYKLHFDTKFRKEGLGLYGACFLVCAEINHLIAEHNHYTKRIPFLMDSGNAYAEHVRGAHAELQEPRWESLKVGSLTFDDDLYWTPLQAADVIAWASRVRVERGHFDNGYEPLIDLFDESHVQRSFPESALDTLAASIESLRMKGDFPL
jgi:hypothetical protein